MKKYLISIVLVIILALFSTSTCSAVTANYNPVNRVQDDDHGSDYIAHYAIGGVIGGLTWYYLPDDWNPWLKGATAIGASMLFKTAWEVFDEPFDSRDILDYGLGAAVSVTILTITF